MNTERFATLNITARAVCDDSKVRRGQPKLSITFRGQGKKISAEEKAGYHPDVLVRFQKKAWADDEVCEEVRGTARDRGGDGRRTCRG